MIKQLGSEQEIAAYMSLMRYCFDTPADYLQQRFPVAAPHSLWGELTDDQKLCCGLTSYSFVSQLYGEKILFNGIGGVGTFPEYRNSGMVRRLLGAALNKAREENCLCSALYPFSFTYYQGLGYGSLAPFKQLKCRPENILYRSYPGIFKRLEEHSPMLTDMYDVYNAWVSRYDLGVIRSVAEKRKIYDNPHNENMHNYLYYSNKGKCAGFLSYTLKKIVDTHALSMQVKRIAWKRPEDLAALLAFIWSHRDQCAVIDLRAVPHNLGIENCLSSPRDYVNLVYTQMARPLHVLKLLELKAAQCPAQKAIKISISDPLIADNTRTYTIRENKVQAQSFANINVVPFDIFSSLLFGFYTFEDFMLCGRLKPSDFDEVQILSGFFPRRENIFLSEYF